MPVDATYVINMATATDRWHRVSGHLRDAGLEFTRFEAVTPLSLGVEDHVHPSCTLACAPGAMGCALSHLGVWKLCATRLHRAALVLEDDVVLVDDFDSKLAKALKAVPADFDILLLGYTNAEDQPTFSTMNLTKRPGKVPPGIIVLKAFYGTHAYVISAAGARKLRHNKVAFQVDIQLSLTSGLNIYAVKDKLAHQKATESYVAPHTFPVTLNTMLRNLEVPGLNLYGSSTLPSWMWTVMLCIISAKVPWAWMAGFFAFEAYEGGVSQAYVTALLSASIFSYLWS